MAKKINDVQSLRCSVCGVTNALIRRFNELRIKVPAGRKRLRLRVLRLKERSFLFCPRCARPACDSCIDWSLGVLRCRSCVGPTIERQLGLDAVSEVPDAPVAQVTDS